MEFPAIATMLGIRRAPLNVGEGNEIENVLVVGGVISLAELEIKAAALQKQLAIAVASIGLLMLLTLFVSTGRLLRPIDVLIKAANRIASGDKNIVIPANNNDEIGTLSRAMTRMAEKLRLAGKDSEQSALGQMASMIAHDLRNALSSVKMNLQILDEHHRKEGGMQIENCEIALGQVRYMETILNDMLTYARPGTAEFDWVDLGDTLRAASVSLLPEITGKSVEVRMEGEEKLPTIMADRNKLLQLFQNVLGNAIYAVPEWGHITIRTRCLLHESQPSVEIRFDDDGPGIPPQIADKVFDPFFTTSARGTGLGLAIVQRIVAQHRGQVYLDSE
ncbi:MAG: HAMP domain-containing histidine kinase, partial [Methylococcales bacterium]|nr:HAMP domain-containing histidine kinase [Methylococcales bacterium]